MILTPFVYFFVQVNHNAAAQSCKDANPGTAVRIRFDSRPNPGKPTGRIWTNLHTARLLRRPNLIRTEKAVTPCIIS